MKLKGKIKNLVVNAHRGLIGDEMFECDECGKLFKTEREIFLHKFEEHVGES
jgi:uncharacterized C2H2 Zn-finger protein